MRALAEKIQRWRTRVAASVRTIADGLDQRSDNFLLLRFIAASLVIYGHAPAIATPHGPQDFFVWLNWGEYSGAIAVDLFFVISGFLITGSYLRRQHIGDYIWARFLRITPAYAVCIVVCACVVGPIFSYYSFRDYFANHGVYEYITGNLQLGQHTLVWKLPGVFSPNRTPAVNGSIWTLPAEVIMYVWVATLGLMTVIRRRWAFNLFFAGLLVYGWKHPDNLWLIDNQSYVRLGALYAAGAFCYVNREHVPNNGILLLCAVLLAYLFRTSPSYPFLFACCEVLLVFWFVYNLRWNWFNRFGDYSYGVYLWGYPSQQIVASLGFELPTYANAICGFALALSLGVLSWHLIEKPALGLKDLPRKLLDNVRSKWQAGQRKSVAVPQTMPNE
jgi:peptidoglycan/LPS O-acetylase OafA/YrhL